MMRRDLPRGVPGLRRWKREYRVCIRILCVMSLCFVFLIGVIVIGDSLEYTEAEKRKEAFGEWDYAISDLSNGDEERIRSIPFLQNCGAVWTYGTIIHSEIKGGYAIGGADPEGKALGRFKLLQGEWPERVGEAAVEASLLRQLGYPSEVGVSIEVRVAPYEKAVFGSHGTPIQRKQDDKTVRLKVCGVIRDYVYGWNISDSYDLPSIFVTEKTAAKEGLSVQVGHSGNRLTYILLLQGKSDWVTMEEDLQSMTLGRDISTFQGAKKQGFRRNENNLSDNSQNVLRLMILSLVRIGSVLGTFILFLCVWYSVKNRMTEWRQLHVLGMKVSSIRILILHEALVFGWIATAGGAAGGVVLALVGKYLQGRGIITLQMHWEVPHLLVAVLLGWGSVMFSYGIPMALARRRILGDRKRRRSFKGKKRKRRMAGLWVICVREWVSHPVFSVTLVVLLCGCIIIPCLGTREIYNRRQRILRAEQRGETGYMIAPADINRSDAGVSKEGVEQLKNIYGASKVIPYHGGNETSYTLQLDVREIPEDPYITQALDEEKRRWQKNLDLLEMDAESTVEIGMMAYYRSLLDSLEKGYCPIHIWTTSEEDAWNSFIEDVTMGTTDLQKLLNGEEVILIMPDLVRIGDDSYYDWISKGVPNPYETERVCYSGGICPGDLIRIKDGRNEKSVRVGGIITAAEHSRKNGLLEAEAFTILSGDPFFESLSLNSSMPANYFQHVCMKVENSADIVTDRLVQKTIRFENAELKNYREEYQRNQTDYLLSIGYYGGTCGLGTIVCVVLIIGLLRLQEGYRAEKNRLLGYMGIPRIWVIVIRGVDVFLPSLTAVFAAFAGVSFLLTAMDRIRLSPEGIAVPFVWRVGFPLRWFIVYCAVFVMVFSWIGVHEEESIRSEEVGESV